MFTMMSKFFIVLYLYWTNYLLGLTTNIINMTRQIIGIATRLADMMHKEYIFIQIWCEVHQLDLIMEKIMNNVIKERWFSAMTRFNTHLTRQQNLIAEMQTTCTHIVNRGLLTEKIITWFKIHRTQLFVHIESKQPASTSIRLWWIAFFSMHHFTTQATVVFCDIQVLYTFVF